MIEVTGKMPTVIKNKLSNAGILSDGLITGGNDIDLTFNAKGTETHLAATFVGNGKWVVDEIDDNANLFPQIEEGDSVSADMITKLFIDSINSGLILSFNPLGKVKYGLMDVGKAVGRAAKKVGKGIADWAADRLDADQAEKFIRTHGPYRRKYFDTRDDKIKEKKDFRGTNINVGKIEKLPGMGHWKVLTGNPDTQDFQVWHLYRNGAKTRVLDLRTNLQAQEAQWAFDNNIPKSWSPSDWQNPDGNQKANEIPLNQLGEEQTQTEEVSQEENNVEETSQEQNTEQVSQEENNVEETSQDTQTEEVNQEEDNTIDNMDPDTWWDESEDEDESWEDKKQIAKSSLNQEEDNVIDFDKKKRKKSKYNGCNVTGYQDGMLGTMATSTWIKQNLMDFYNAMAKKDIKGEPEKQLNKIMKAIKDILSVNPKLASEMTKQSTDNLTIDFSVVPNANMKYVITLEFTENGVNVSGSGLPEKDKLGFTLDCLNKVIKTISGIKPVNRKP